MDHPFRDAFPAARVPGERFLVLKKCFPSLHPNPLDQVMLAGSSFELVTRHA